MNKVLLSVTLLVVPFYLNAQDTRPAEIKSHAPEDVRSVRKLGIGVTLLGPVILGSYSIDYLVTPTIDLELGYGTGFYGGGKYLFYPSSIKNTKPFVGIHYANVDAEQLNYNKAWRGGFYFPIGLQYIGNKGFTTEAELAFRTNTKEYENSPMWLGFKLGYHFKTKK